MVLSPENTEQPKPKEIIFNSYGIYLVTDQDAYSLTNKKDPALEDSRNVVLVSEPDWATTVGVLDSENFGKTTVLTPELITVAGQQLTTLYEHRYDIEKALGKVSEISQAQPDTTFIIGSPDFVPGQKLPFNAAIVFKNGQRVQVAHKKLLMGEEGLGFDIDPKEKPTVVGETALLICRDLFGASETSTRGGDSIVSYVQRTTKDSSLAERFKGAQFIAPDTRRILVASCWGVGPPIFKESAQEDINADYLSRLKVMSRTILEMDPNVGQIIVCDRAPLNRKIYDASEPMSAVFFKR